MAEDKPHSKLFGTLGHALLSGGLGLRFRARGTSMAPTIRDGEILHIKPVAVEKLSKGDIVLFANGPSFRAHRLIALNRNRDVFVTRGDAATERDIPLRAEQIMGKVTAKEDDQNCSALWKSRASAIRGGTSADISSPGRQPSFHLAAGEKTFPPDYSERQHGAFSGAHICDGFAFTRASRH